MTHRFNPDCECIDCSRTGYAVEEVPEASTCDKCPGCTCPGPCAHCESDHDSITLYQRHEKADQLAAKVKQLKSALQSLRSTDQVARAQQEEVRRIQAEAALVRQDREIRHAQNIAATFEKELAKSNAILKARNERCEQLQRDATYYRENYNVTLDRLIRLDFWFHGTSKWHQRLFKKGWIKECSKKQCGTSHGQF